MERVELEIKRLIDYCAEQIHNGKLDGEKVPDLDTCIQELRVLVETYVAVVVRNDKRF